MITHLNPLYEVVDTSCYNDNQKVALTSYMYNTWVYAMNINKHIKKCNIRDIKYIMSVYWYSSNWIRLQWLVNRRYAELELFNK